MIRAIFILFLVGVSLARAELVFETLDIDGGRADISDTKFVGKFPFKNTGDETVKIMAVNSSCGCTTPTLPKKEYLPGESGVITATFEFGARTGHQQKKITVVTNDGTPNKRTVLSLEVVIPRVLDVSPRVVVWDTKKSESGPKSFKMKLDDQVKAEIRFKEPTPEGFEFSLSPSDEEGVDYVLTMTPDSMDRKRGKLDIEVVDENGEVIATSYAFGIIR